MKELILERENREIWDKYKKSFAAQGKEGNMKHKCKNYLPVS